MRPRFSRERVKQAAAEFAYTFGAVFAVSFYAWVTGWTKLPNLGEVTAFFTAAGTAAALALAKAVLWFFTGTMVPRDPR